MSKRWTEKTRPICPMNLKTGDKGCYTQCVYCFEDGEKDGEKLFGCLMVDEMALRVDKLRREVDKPIEAPFMATAQKRRVRPSTVGARDGE